MASTSAGFGSRRARLCLLLAILAAHGGLLAYSAAVHSPTYSEVNHLPAGLSHLYLHRFDLFRVNPPLVRTVAAIPVALLSPETDWRRYDDNPAIRRDMVEGQDFLKANGERALWFFTVARRTCIPFSLLGGYACFRFAGELYGSGAGWIALILWCSCPYILGHAALITPDAPAAALGITAYYAFWRWLKRPSIVGTITVGVLLGLAQLTKTTLLIFYPLWALTWIVYWFGRPALEATDRRRETAFLLGAFLMSGLVVNFGYGFERSFRPLGQFDFNSSLLSGIEPESHEPHVLGNRFRGGALGSLPVPLPANYLQGIDAQRWDFERKMPSYLGGEWRDGGWWYYYLYALAIKLPLGTWFIVLLAIGVSALGHGYSAAWRDEVVLLLPTIGILVFVSSQTGFSIHSRYVLPVLPLLFVWISKVGRCVALRQWNVTVLAAVALVWSVGSSLWYYPHSLSYFNELVDGPTSGHEHLLDSNIAWGQDLYDLKRWYDAHPQARPFHLAYFGLVDPRLVGIDFTLPPVFDSEASDMSPERGEPKPGWYAIDVNHLHGSNVIAADGQGGWTYVKGNGTDLTYFQRVVPVARAGYSIYIYHVEE